MGVRLTMAMLCCLLIVPAAWGEQSSAAEAQPYVYDPVGKRDPFQSLLEIRRPVARAEEPQTPLQQFELSQLRLVGAIVGKGDPRAMVLAPDGKSYVLRVGTKVGKNNGVVHRILQDQVIIEEAFYDFTGEVRKNLQTIAIPRREGV